MRVSERLQRASMRVLDGDESVAAAQELEAVLLDEYLGDDNTSALLEGLALYAPGSGAPYLEAPELRGLVSQTLEVVASQMEADDPCG